MPEERLLMQLCTDYVENETRSLNYHRVLPQLFALLENSKSANESYIFGATVGPDADVQGRHVLRRSRTTGLEEIRTNALASSIDVPYAQSFRALACTSMHGH